MSSNNGKGGNGVIWYAVPQSSMDHLSPCCDNTQFVGLYAEVKNVLFHVVNPMPIVL